VESNYYQARQAFLHHVDVPERQIHRIHGEQEAHKAADEYGRTLRRYAAVGRQWPRFDVALLGLGSDGHTASLFPGEITAAEERQPALAVTGDYDGRPAERVTLTPRVFNDAQHLFFLVTGGDKAAAVRDALEGEYRPKERPAQRIQPRFGTLTWLLDSAAAAQLTEKEGE
jgi:6-phosphogluconolactonase